MYRYACEETLCDAWTLDFSLELNLYIYMNKTYMFRCAGEETLCDAWTRDTRLILTKPFYFN